MLQNAGYRVGIVLVLAVAALLATLAVTEASNGPIALLQVLAAHVALLVLLAAVGLAIASRARLAVLSLAVLLLVAGIRFGDEWVSPPASPPGGTTIRVVTWNIEIGVESAHEILEPVLRQSADIVALQEVTAGAAAILEASADIRTRFPHRIVVPDPTVAGLGILSAYPILGSEIRVDPRGLLARLEVAGAPLSVLNAHPYPGTIQSGPLRMPVGFDATRRNERLEGVLEWLDDIRRDGAPAVVLADLNLAPSEPVYRRLAGELVDAHREIGQGTGWTWRPTRLQVLGLGTLRIDYVLMTGALRPIATWVDCAVASDHCLLGAELARSAPSSSQPSSSAKAGIPCRPFGHPNRSTRQPKTPPRRVGPSTTRASAPSARALSDPVWDFLLAHDRVDRLVGANLKGDSMEQSDVVRDALLAFYTGINAKAVERFDDIVSANPATLVIGTAPGEWVSDRAGLRFGFEAEGLTIEAGPNPSGYRQGSMGWFVDEPWYGFPGGGGMRTRLTGIVVEEGGLWKVTHLHVSVGVPDEEVQQLQSRWGVA